jgi:hypothetical protein
MSTTLHASNPMTAHEMRGLDGINMLAFMAALGALRVMSTDHPDLAPTLRWELKGTWTPILECRCARKDLVAHLHASLRSRATLAELCFADDIKQNAEQFRTLVDQASAAPASEREERLRWLAAFASEACVDPYSKEGILSDTALRTMQGAGHQHFLKTIRTNLAAVTEESLSADLFEAWRYEHEGLVLRWDPADDRDHAYRWKNPSEDKSGAVLGALALAGAALPLFTVSPQQQGLGTLGFGAKQGRRQFTWPLWRPPLSSRAVGSLLALEELQATTPDRNRLGALGVEEVRRSLRVQRGKTRNFSPSWAP